MKAINLRPEDYEHNNLSPQGTGFTRGEGVTKGVYPDNGFGTLQLKPRFYLFQRIRDQLYQNPPTLVEQTSSMEAYFGALGFTKLLEKLVLRAMPLQILLDWLSKPKGPNLVEASTAATPDKALALAVTKQMLYGEETPLVGVGLMYKPHYISTEPFSALLHASACMAHCRLPCRVGGQAKFIMPPLCKHLRDEWCDTCGGATSHPIGCGNEGGDDKNW